MPENNPNPVVVAVGPDPIESALIYGVTEANRSGCGVHLIHTVHRMHDGPDSILIERSDLDRIGHQTLEAAEERARDLAGADVPVTSDLVRGPVVPSIIETSADARMIVLEHRALSSMARVVTRSVSSGVASRAHVPVVSVPAGWAPPAERGEAMVTVGVELTDQSNELLRIAAETAASRSATLHILHTWSYPSAYEDLVISREEDEDWAKAAAADIQTVLDGLDGVESGVPARIDVRHAQPADALVAASHDSDLLVVGRHNPVVPFGSHLGPVARAVLREAVCPVMLVDTRPGRRVGPS